MSYYNSPQPPQYNGAAATEAIVSGAMKRVYLKMTLGLVVTAFVAMFAVGNDIYARFVLTNRWAFWGLAIAELVLVFAISGGINRMKTSTGTYLFYLFSALNGLSLAPIFLVYTGASIAKTFFITAGMFGAMSIYGYLTNKDLSRWGSLLFMALIGLIIAMLVNFFIGSETLDYIISFIGVLIFVGLTAWDTQFIKQQAAIASPDQIGRVATIGALNLYLDFVNMFLYLLRLFGDRD